MRRKTQKHNKKRHIRPTAIQTIPELRLSFDYIDEFVKHRIQSGTSKEQLVKEVRREWERVFSKSLQKKNATAFVEHMMERFSKRRGLRGTRKRTRGGVAPFMDPTTQQGLYLASGKPPTTAGHFPLANQATSVYGSLSSYLTKGFQTPEQSVGLDPIKGQTQYATSAPLATNAVLQMKGGRRRLRGGAPTLVGTLLQQFTTRPVPSSSPPNMGQDAQTAWYGRNLGSSPDQAQRSPPYALGDSVFPKLVNVKIDV